MDEKEKIPEKSALDRSVDDILAQFGGSDTYGRDFSEMAAKYLGSDAVITDPALFSDISDRSGENYKKERVVFDDPEVAPPPPPENVSAKIIERLTPRMREIYASVEHDAQSPGFTSGGEVIYPSMGVGASEERVVFDADWEDKAKQEAAERESFRRESMPHSGSDYTRGFVTGGKTMDSHTGYGVRKPLGETTLIDPLSDDRELDRAAAMKPVPARKTALNRTERKEPEMDSTEEKKSFFQEGFPAEKINDNSAAGGETAAVRSAENAAIKAQSGEKVVSSLSSSDEKETEFRERWKATVEQAQKRKAERLARAEEQRLAEEKAQKERDNLIKARELSEEKKSAPLDLAAINEAERRAQERKAAAQQKKEEEPAPAAKTDVPEVKKTAPKENGFVFDMSASEKEEEPAPAPENEKEPAPRQESFFGIDFGDDAADAEISSEDEKLTIADIPAKVSEKPADSEEKTSSKKGGFFAELPEKIKRFFTKEGFKEFVYKTFPNKDDAPKEIVRKCVRVVSLIAFLIAAIWLIVYFADFADRIRTTHGYEDEMSQLEQMGEENLEDAWKQIKIEYPDIDFPEGMNIKFAKLYAINQDVVGWLKIENTNIDTVLLQSTNNSYHLHRNIYGEYTRFGNPYVHWAADMTKTGLSKNTIVFGHNANDGLMFHDLVDYMTLKGYYKAPVVSLDTLYESTKWKVFAVMITNILPEDDNGHVFEYLYTNFSSGSSFMSYIASIEERSMIHTGVDVNANDRILTLYTCNYYPFSDSRLVVFARQIRDGESEEIDTSKVYWNSNCRYPQKYYDKKGLTNPFAEVEETTVKISDQAAADPFNETASTAAPESTAASPETPAVTETPAGTEIPAVTEAPSSDEQTGVFTEEELEANVPEA